MVWSNQAPTSLTFPPGATTGERVVIDDSGIKAYDTNGELYFSLDADTPSNSEIIMPPGATTGTRVVLNELGLTGYDNSDNEYFNISGSAGPDSKWILPPDQANETHAFIGSRFNINGTTVSGFAIYDVTGTQIQSAMTTGEPLMAQNIALIMYPGASQVTVAQFFSGSDSDPNSGMRITTQGGVLQIGLQPTNDIIQILQAFPGQTYMVGKKGSGFAIPNSAWTSIDVTGFTNVANRSDYAGVWSGTNWTAPVDGFYDFTFTVTNLAQAGPVSYGLRMLVNGTSTFGDIWNGTAVIQPRTLNASPVFLNAGDVINFQVFQASGATINVNTQIYVARRW